MGEYIDKNILHHRTHVCKLNGYAFSGCYHSAVFILFMQREKLNSLAHTLWPLNMPSCVNRQTSEIVLAPELPDSVHYVARNSYLLKHIWYAWDKMLL